MNSKSYILDSIRKNNIVKDVPLPEYENFGIKYENLFEQFLKIIKTVGGDAVLSSAKDLDETIKALYKDEKVIYSNVQECSLGNFDANKQEDVHDLQDIDLAIVHGEFGVAENGAVWVKNKNNRHRALYFICQNIVLVIKKEDLVHNMHEAYEKIDFNNASYGTFISGPSKTADIEQSLVIGAHGPKSGYVIFI